MTISPLRSVPAIEPPRPAGKSDGTAAFRSMLESTIQNLETTRQTADQAVDGFLTGGGEDLHTTALAVQRSELELELALQVRNKVVQAYQEIMRLQI
ncbi:MAG: flagellar hook-basal body complex protein FliE [Acidobacteria bacterium]|nr:flagellar hook-basal body complex protein FliE [Acidobacteriota bacterium]